MSTSPQNVQSHQLKDGQMINNLEEPNDGLINQAAIDEHGDLVLIRKGKVVPSYCPYSQFKERCGQVCPFFYTYFSSRDRNLGIKLFCGHSQRFFYPVEDMRKE